LLAENLFLRKQLVFYQERAVKPRRLTDVARLSLALWSRWFSWEDALVIVKPETLIGWHRQRLQAFLAMKIASRQTTIAAGNPRIDSVFGS
jgi:hypothetical protein